MSSFAEIPIARRKDLCPLFAKHKHVRPSADAVLRGHSGQPANRRTGEPANWRTGELANRRTAEPANRRTGEPANWLTGRLADWPTG